LDLQQALGDAERSLVEQDLGIGSFGASLVRPDGVVAWRSGERAASVKTLADALRDAACVRTRAG
jgi:hypothetical protein